MTKIITDPEKDNIAVSVNNNTRIKPSNDLPGPLENINNKGSNKISVVNVQPIIPGQNNSITKNDIGINKLKIPDEPVKQVPDNKSVEPAISYAKNAVYNEKGEDKNDTRILYMDEEKVRRTSLGGFFRKIKRVIERNTNPKTGNGIQVAGFEIAVK